MKAVLPSVERLRECCQISYTLAVLLLLLLLHCSTMDASVDTILEEIGFGTWQILCATAVCLFQASSAVQYVNTVFVNKPNVTACYNQKLDKRLMQDPGYDFNTTHIIEKNNNLNLSSLEAYHDECESTSPYIASYFYENTFSNEFNLIDDKAWISPLYQMTFVSGVIFGNAVSGVSDILGRLVIIRWGAVGYVISSILVSVAPQIHVVLISRFIIGFTHEFFQTPALTLLMEITPVQYRSSLGIIVFLPYCIAGVLLGGLSYFIRPWRTLHIISLIPVFLLAIFVVFLTKSPRWLMTQGCFQEAADIFEKAAKMNKGTLPPREELISIMKKVHESDDTAEQHPLETQKHSKMEQAQAFLFQFFATPHMLKVSIITPFLWLVVGLVYYGITLNANNFTSNSYLYISLVHALEIFPTIGGSIFINRLGNILSSKILSAFTGICLLGVLVLPDEVWWLKWTLVMIAFMAIGYLFVLCFVMANELYPTVVRSTGSGFCSLTSNVGTLLASYLYEIVVHQVWWVPNCVCVVFCFMATVLVGFLPETNGLPLCETVHQVEKRGNEKLIEKKSSKTNGKRVCERTDCDKEEKLNEICKVELT